jgi:P-type Ca2+ transporter type 2C
MMERTSRAGDAPHRAAPATTDTTPTAWHQLDAAAALGQLGTTEAGLQSGDAAAKLAQVGPNELVESGSKSPWRILWEQFTATMVLVLIVAAVLYAAVSGIADALPIIAIVVLFALLGFVQEYRAERAMAALKKLAVPSVRVRRDGRVGEISARDLVPGDIVLLEAGNVVPADARLIESINLRIQEAALTGESEPVEKMIAALPEGDQPLGDRRNMAYMGTVVTYGRGQAVITATGMKTELGRIATLLQNVQQEYTPLQRRLDQVGRTVAYIAIAIAALILLLGVIQGQSWSAMFLTAISVAVAAVPEGLPAVVTITLALGAQRMLRRNALLRKLPAVETLGSVTVIASDKTGTLTENKMTVTVLDVADHRIDLLEQLDSEGRAFDAAKTSSIVCQYPAQELLLVGGALCNDATLQTEGDNVRAVGDPTEGALVVAAHRLNLEKSDLEAAFPRVAELPFDSERKRMTTVHSVGDQGSGIGNQGAGIGNIVERIASALPASSPRSPAPAFVSFTKGSVDGLLDESTHIWTNGHAEPMTPQWRDRVLEGNNQLAQGGMRVLGVAMRPLQEVPDAADMERDLIFVGLFGMIDPPRAEVKDAVATAKAAGIRPLMITGDHALTAQEIARQLGIATNDRVLTGQELDRMGAAELQNVVDDVAVYARVSPEHKLKIVEALQAKGQIVAMTGDGVNDAPALKKADIGVAMGITGTDVSKEAADMVLRDDNFATIVAAVEEGRTIYDNLRKFIKFSIAGNIGKVLTVFVGTIILGPLLGMPLVLLPLQLLWLNFLTDGLLGLGLGVEGTERDAMRRPPTKPGESIFARGVGWQIAWTGVLIGALALAIGVFGWFADHPNWQTLIFTTLAFAQVGQALAIRSNTDSLFRIGLLSNRVMLATIAAVVALQVLVVYWAPLQAMFDTTPLTALDMAISVAAGVIVFFAIEIEKWWKRRSDRRRAEPMLQTA